MSGKNEQIGLNGFEVWAFVVELDDGLRLRLSLDDWHQLNLDVGRRIPVRLHDREDVWLIVTNVTELPPIAWIMLVKRVRVAV